MFKLTYNDNSKFGQVQSKIIFYLPSKDNNDNWLDIKANPAPPGIKYVEFDPLGTK